MGGWYYRCGGKHSILRIARRERIAQPAAEAELIAYRRKARVDATRI